MVEGNVPDSNEALRPAAAPVERTAEQIKTETKQSQNNLLEITKWNLTAVSPEQIKQAKDLITRLEANAPMLEQLKAMGGAGLLEQVKELIKTKELTPKAGATAEKVKGFMQQIEKVQNMLTEFGSQILKWAAEIFKKTPWLAGIFENLKNDPISQRNYLKSRKSLAQVTNLEPLRKNLVTKANEIRAQKCRYPYNEEKQTAQSFDFVSLVQIIDQGIGEKPATLEEWEKLANNVLESEKTVADEREQKAKTPTAPTNPQTPLANGTPPTSAKTNS
jgi:hypothetical protein